jgi:hypothetical protein
MKYAVEIASCGIIYLQSFIIIGSGFQKLLERIRIWKLGQ